MMRCQLNDRDMRVMDEIKIMMYSIKTYFSIYTSHDYKCDKVKSYDP